jgi:hypothetical protein
MLCVCTGYRVHMERLEAMQALTQELQSHREPLVVQHPLPKPGATQLAAAEACSSGLTADVASHPAAYCYAHSSFYMPSLPPRNHPKAQTGGGAAGSPRTQQPAGAYQAAAGGTGRAAVLLAELDMMEALTAKLAGRMYQ